MKANVTMPDMSISSDVLEFEEVKCGECKVITIQLHNHMEVRCEWTATGVPQKERRRVSTQSERFICTLLFGQLIELLVIKGE